MARSSEYLFSDDRVHAPIAVGGLLVTGKAGIDQFTDAWARDPKVLALRSKVEVVRDSASSIIAAAVEITTADAGRNPRHDVAPLIDGIWALDKSTDVSKLASLAVPLG
jgi:hypothetical protein